MTAVEYDTASSRPAGGATLWSQLTRMIAWGMLLFMFVYIIDNYLTVWLEWPGAMSLFEGGDEGGGTLAVIQAALYIGAIVGGIAFVLLRPGRALRQDGEVFRGVTNYIIKAAFWSVTLIGLADMTISFLRVEGLLEVLLGPELGGDLGRSHFRGPYVHMPLIAVALVMAFFFRTLGFQWLALLVVLAELAIVLSRFVFSYEQAFQGDLVRFWYGALFLFASAHTLYEDGHVRVDVLYAGFSETRKGWINYIGCLFLGLPLCWVILIFGLSDRSGIINSSLLTFEVSQSGFGMYVKFWMAAFLGIFAVSMMVQFLSYLMHSLADIRGEPGHHEAHPGIT
jgi:TRAP-type mannitol/chloroaromatic compound transport system permease small subunit